MPILTWMRPSCGSRFSAMLIEPVIIFMRLMMALCNFFGGLCISCSTPSMRKRTRKLLSSGSRWISLARILWASSSSSETILMMGASSPPVCPSPTIGPSPNLDFPGAERALQLAHRVVRGAVVFDERGLDLPRSRADEFHIPPQDVAHGIEGIEVERIARGHHQAGIGGGDRHHLVTARRLGGQQLDDFGSRMLICPRSTKSMLAAPAMARATSSSLTAPCSMSAGMTAWPVRPHRCGPAQAGIC